MPTTPRSKTRLIDYLLLVALAGFAAVVARILMGKDPLGAGPMQGYLLVGSIAGFFLLFNVWRGMRARRVTVICPECERPFVPVRDEKGASPTTCTRCRARRMKPADFRAQKSKGYRAIVMIILWLSAILGMILWSPMGERFPENRVAATVLASLGASIGLFASIVGLLVIRQWIKHFLGAFEGNVVRRARRASGFEGDLTREGPLSIWTFGRGEPAAMIAGRAREARARFGALLGVDPPGPGPLRALVFETRAGFEGYHGKGLDLSAFDGVFQGGRSRTLTLCLDRRRHRISRPERTALSLFGFAALERFRGSPAPTWIQQGVGAAVAAGPDVAALDRLDRRMRVALARGRQIPPADFLKATPNAMFRLLAGVSAHERYVQLLQLHDQSWSFVDFLAGPRAPADRRAGLRGLILDRRLRRGGEPVFEEHLGFGYDRALELWRESIVGRPAAPHAPPPADVRDAILGSIVPAIDDPSAPIMNRIDGVRSLGSTGFVLGADSLIAGLETPGEIPAEELVWALESISGLTLGDDLDGWHAWWDALPEEPRRAGSATPTAEA